ncbi:DNA-binding response regulator, OmpR family, contains REC and winged-helix (wHTH) domain [Marinobacter sp. DSM 26671]|jgi:DNA-binding response OmpR family regulator|uniref:response regulator transcription factor n=1 Tax=Marinobacter sp. DSM 26671 TaxID=1761793 RepID=UPI0008E15FCF|nr:response regulator transcription factor [Marinobacter sp. DSM 26671]SFD95502.1 DNA-binding response regulator, OmpR family, contains REC and winged-helix (wHTH) domain [Marinobacter sp. DSM 26671]
MNIAVLSSNKGWKDFLMDLIDLPSHDIDSLEFDINDQTPITKNYDLILLDVESEEQDLSSLLIFKIRMSVGWSPYLIAVSTDKSIGRNRLLRAVSSGADDFLDDVYDMNALLTKVSAVTRRRYFEITQSRSSVNYSIKVREKVVLVNGDPVKLNDKEFELFLFFYGNTDSVFSRESIYNYLWGDGKTRPTRTLDTHISRIRKRLKLDGSYGLRLKPIYGVGYILESEVQ